MYAIALQVIFGRTVRSMRMNNDLIFAFQMYKARLVDLMRQAEEDRLCRRLNGVGEVSRTRRYKIQSGSNRRNRIFPETNYSGSGVSLV